MNIIQPTEDQLNEFVLKNSGSFQQSWQWGELQGRMGRKTNRLLIIDNNNRAVASALFVKHDLPFGKYYLFCPRGPVIASSSEAIPLIQRLLRRFTPRNDKNCIFIRIEPETFNFPLSILNLRKAPKDHNPRATVLINLGKTEEELLTEMHNKTRYNIKLAQKKNVQVKFPISNFQFPIFWNLLEKTARKDKFHLHPRKYYEELSGMEEVKLFEALPPLRPPLNKGGKGGVLAAAMVSFWADKAVYLHGASDYEVRNLMAPYLLHWEIIRQAKREGLKYYDFGGVAPSFAKASEGTAHPLAGISRFKQGFGGEYVEYVGSLDYVLSPMWYSIYKMARRVL